MVAFSPDWGVDKTDEETLRAHSRSHTTVATAEIFAEKEHMMRRLRNKLGRKRAEAHETQATNDRSGNNLLLSVTGMQSQSLPQRAAASPILGTPATTPKSPKPSSPPPQPPRPQQGSGQPKLAHLGPGGTKKDYWKMAAEKLQEEDPSFKDAIAGLERAATTAGDNDFAMQLQAATERSRKELESRKWRFNVGSKEIIPREHFDGLIKTVAAIKDLASAAAGVDPIHAGLPLAGFLVLMQMATNDFDQYASMAAGVEEVMTIMARYRLIEESHGQRLQDGLKQEFDKQLINLYKHIIRYQISATTYYRRNTMARYIRAMPKLDDLKEVTLAVRQQDDACWKIVDILYSAGIDLRLDQLEQRLTAPNVLATPSANMHWIVPRSTNSLFTGRNAILDELKVIIQNAVNEPTPDQQCRIVVTGIGGQGKSKLCLQLANRCRALFWGVFWIDVGSTSLAEQAFISLAQQLQISAQTWEEACQALGALQDRWLLVLDNADDRCVNYQRYFPASTLGVVLLTSRNDQFHCYATNKHVPLGGLGDKEARELLLRAAGVAADKHQDRDAQTQQDFDRDADRVATLLYSHPLALIQAAAYVARGHCPLAAYPQVYEKQRKRLLQFHPEQAQSRYSDVYTTFEASVSILQSVDAEACRDALSLLPVLAVFERNRLPIFLFEEAWRGAQAVKADPRDVEPDMEHLHTWHLDRLPPWMQMNEQAWDSFRLIQALSELRALSLVMTDTQEGYMSISMHPLVHAWARDRESEAEQHLSSVVAGCLVALSADYSIWAQYSHLLQAHLEAVVSLELNQLFRSEPLVMINGIIFRCGYLLRNMRADDQLSALLTRWFGYHNWSLTKVEQTALGAYRLAADDSLHQGYYPQAITLLKQVLEIRIQTLPATHPDRLACQRGLASAYHVNNQVDKAVSLLEQVVKICNQTYPETHPARLACQHGLALAYYANNQVDKAVLLLEPVLEIYNQTHSETHPDRLACQRGLALAYHANNQVDKAVLLLEPVLEIYNQTYSETHPDRLACQRGLALAYHANNQVDKAVSLLEQVVKIQNQTHPETHLNRLASEHNLAVCLWESDRRQDAVQLLQHVVEVQRCVLNEDHPSRRKSEECLRQVKAQYKRSNYR